MIMCNINIINFHYCKFLVTKLYILVFGKSLANSRLQIVGDKHVVEVCGDLRDRKSSARFDERRTVRRGGGSVVI